MKISNCLIHRIENNKITIRQQLLEDHTLKGKNRESPKWDRRTFFTKVLIHMKVGTMVLLKHK